MNVQNESAKVIEERKNVKNKSVKIIEENLEVGNSENEKKQFRRRSNP